MRCPRDGEMLRTRRHRTACAEACSADTVMPLQRGRLARAACANIRVLRPPTVVFARYAVFKGVLRPHASCARSYGASGIAV